MHRSPNLPYPALLAFLLVCAPSVAEASVEIDVDANNPIGPLEPVWAYYGYDEVNYTTTSEGERLLRTLAAANSAPVHVRTHFLFNTGDGTPSLKWGSTNLYTEDQRNEAVYSFTLIDDIMDATVGAGVFPLVEIGFMPEALSTRPEPYQNTGTYVLDGGCFYPPDDYEKWAELVTTWATHVKERYPEAESNWQWELWNEPDIGYWRGTFDEFAKLYDYTEAALHAVFPNAPLGGPAVVEPDGTFMRDFLEHCATGTNAVSGQTGTRLDMITFHAKGGVTLTDEDTVQMNLGNQLKLHRAGFSTVHESGVFADRPIVITEADPEGCAACLPSVWQESVYRTSPAYGAYEVAMMKHSLDLANEADVNLRGVLTWAFTFPDSPYFIGYRALASNGIHLPVLNAFKLLGKLRGARLPVASSGARPLYDIVENGVRQEADVDALAAIDGNRIRIVVFNYHDDLIESEPTPVTLNVEVPWEFGDRAVVKHTRVDDTHGNAHAVWQAQGSPEAPSAAQLAELREAMAPVLLEQDDTSPVVNGAVSLSFDLPRFGISLLTLEFPPGSEREALPKSGTFCSCRVPGAAPASCSLFCALTLALSFARRRSRRCAENANAPCGSQTERPARATSRKNPTRCRTTQ